MENTIANPNPVQVIGRASECMRRLMEAGLPFGALQMPIDSPDMRKRLVEFWVSGGYDGQLSKSQKLARALMGANFWGPEEWAKFYGVIFTDKQLCEISEFPWGKDVLNAPCPFVKGGRINGTHFAFLGLDCINGKPLIILKWHELHPAAGQPKFFYPPYAWYDNQKFATEVTCGLRWYLMPLNSVPNSTNKTYQEQAAMLPSDYEVPRVIEEVTKNILYYRKSYVHLNPWQWSWCQELASDGSHVRVGCFNEGGLRIDYGRSDAGIATARRLPSIRPRAN